MMTMVELALVALAVSGLGLLVAAYAAHAGGKRGDGGPMGLRGIVIGTCIGLGMALAGLALFAAVCLRHGALPSHLRERTVAELIRMNARSVPVERSKAPESGQVFVYVRYGCGDCECVSRELYADLCAARGEGTVDFAGFYDVESEMGKALLEEYPVSLVPMVVRVCDDGGMEEMDPCLKGEDDTCAGYDTEAVLGFLQDDGTEGE